MFHNNTITAKKSSNFAFLQQVQADFCRQYGNIRIKLANAYGMNSNFQPTLRSLMHHYNINHKELARDDKVRQLMGQVSDMKDVMGRNIEVMLHTQESSLQTLKDTSDQLMTDAQVFRQRGSVMLRKQRIRLCMMYGGTVVVAILLLTWVTLAFCGFGLQYCRS